jgi:hypothetical protein
MPLYRLPGPLPALEKPVVLAAFDGWVDAGSAATNALAVIGAGAPVIADFDPDALFDYRSRRPTLEIRDGRLSSLAWPEISLRHARFGGRDVLVLTGAEPDDRWRRFGEDTMELLARLGVSAWVSLGAIPAAVPHTRPIPILGTEGRPGLLRGGVVAGPTGLLRVPSAALSMLEMAADGAGMAAVGYFAQIPHYVSGPYALAAVELLRAVERHLDIELPRGDLADEARQLRLRLDGAAAADDATLFFVGRLDALVDHSRRHAGSDLLSDVQQVLRGQSRGGS